MTFFVQIFSQNENGKDDYYSSYEKEMVNVIRLLNVYKPKKDYEIVEILVTPTLDLMND